MLRQCKKCDNLFQATAKGQKKCEGCKLPIGQHKKKYIFRKSNVDHKKLMILKRKLDKMSYERAIE